MKVERRPHLIYFFLLPISTIVVSNAGWVGKSISILTPEKWDATVKLDHVFTQVAGLITTSEVVFAFIIAAVAAALMSTVDTLINAVAAVVVNDVYKPIVKDRDDKHYLKVAMIVSAGATALGAISVVFFNNFPTLYEAHGFFHSTMTPPLVVAIFLGIFWKRYTTEAAVATFIGGAFLMWLGNKYPGILIAPFDHGIEMDPEHPYSYIRALYNTLVCLSVGVVVSLFTTPKTEEEMDGITVWSLDRAREKFKGSKPNDREGKKPITTWKIVEGQDELVRFSQKEMDFMAAEVGDLVYISDSRGWLGGLKSCHSVYGKVHDEEGMVYISAEIADSAMFVEGKTVKSEKEM